MLPRALTTPTRTCRSRAPRAGYTRRVRFAIRAAKLADAEGIARAHTASWQTSYRGILPDAIVQGREPLLIIGAIAGG